MSRLSKALIAGLLIGMLGVTASLVPFVLGLEENIGLDLLFKLRGSRKTPADVIVITVDKASADYLNLPTKPYKWPRSLHARLTENLADKGASVIAFDMIFDEARSAEEDNLFAEAIRNTRNVVMCEHLKKERISLTDEDGRHAGDLDIETLVPPIPPLARSAVALAPFPLPKVPVKVSQYWLFKEGAGGVPTLPVVVFQIFALDVHDEFTRLLKKVSPSEADKLPHDKDSIIRTGNVEKVIRNLRDIFEKKPLVAEKMLEELENSEIFSIDMKKNQILKSLIRMYQGTNSRYLNFYGPPGTIKTVSYHQLLQREESSAVNERQLDLNGKAVFVGLSQRLWSEQKDGFHTVFSQSSGLDISGVEIAACAFANLLEDMPVRPLVFHANVALFLFWGLAMGILCLLFPSLIAAVSVIGVSVVYLVAAEFQFKSTGTWYPLVIPLLIQAPTAYFGAVLWKYFETNRERQNIKMAFGYYLPDAVVDQLAKDIAYIKSNSQMVYGTCLFTDAEHYTALSENMALNELSTFMNNYYETIFEPVKQHGGIVSDVVGDSMLAIWATAHPDAALRTKACLTALDIADAVDRFNQSSHTMQLPTSIGLHSGKMMLGSIGAIHHYEYRAVGDVVNSASRLQGLNKHLGTQILVSEDALYQLDGFLTRELGEFLLVGKSRPIKVFELISRMEKSNEQQRNLCTIFTEALNAFRRQSWQEAIEGFYECMRMHRGDGPSIFYIPLCRKYRDYPPGETWRGLISIDKK